MTVTYLTLLPLCRPMHTKTLDASSDSQPSTSLHNKVSIDISYCILTTFVYRKIIYKAEGRRGAGGGAPEGDRVPRPRPARGREFVLGHRTIASGHSDIYSDLVYCN